jgi:hypothetical protein
MVHRGISRRVLRDTTYDPGHWTFYFCGREFGLVVSVVVPLMLAVLPYARGYGFDFYLLCEPICVSLRLFQSNMSMNDGSSLDIDLHNALTKASCQLLTNVQKVLRMTPMPGRRHYLFTLKDITTCFQVMNRSTYKHFASPSVCFL